MEEVKVVDENVSLQSDSKEILSETDNGKKKRVKKPLTKGKKIALIIVLANVAAILIPVIVLAIMFGPTAYKMWYVKNDTGVNKVDTELTSEQRLSDLEYMYNLVCLNSPSKEVYEEAYGISYEDVYNRYRGLVADCDSEFEYIGYLMSFLSVLPGQHNYMYLPDYQKNIVEGQFSMIEICGTQEIKDYSYSWKEDFYDDVRDCLNYDAYIFSYVDGSYIGISSTLYDNVSDEYVFGKIISIDGKDPNDLCFDYLSAYAPSYDMGHDCFFRSKLIFNSGMGEKHSAEILMSDGTILNADLYDDPAFESAILDGPERYEDLFPKYQEYIAADKSKEDDIPDSYRIFTDEERHLVYVESLSCNHSEGEQFKTDFKEAVDRVDAETVIIDVRSNGGGDVLFSTGDILPMVFNKDMEYICYSYGYKNQHTRHFYSSPFYTVFMTNIMNFKLKTDKDKYYLTEDCSIKGQAEKEYKIYLLTSQDTFSAADTMSRICSEYDDVVLVGTNTGGEGVCGIIINCYLPESRFVFNYMPSTNIYYPEDGVCGTMPDVYMPCTYEEYIYRREMKQRGEDPDTYENRLEWDKTLIYVIDEVDNG